MFAAAATLALALLAQAAADLPVPQGPPSAAVAAEMKAIGQKLETFRGGVYKKDGKLTCRIAASSGDKAIDMVRCGAMLRCYAPRADELDAIAASAAPKAERSRKMQAVVASTQPCVTDASAAGVRMLAEERAGR